MEIKQKRLRFGVKEDEHTYKNLIIFRKKQESKASFAYHSCSLSSPAPTAVTESYARYASKVSFSSLAS